MNRASRDGRMPSLKLILALVVALALALAVTACGSSGSSSSSSSGGSSSTSESESEPEGGGEAEAGDSASAGVKEATEAMEAAMKTPTKWEGPTEPVKAKEGVKLAVIACDQKLNGCTEPGKVAGQVASEHLGWDVKEFDGQSNPKLWNEQMEEADNEGAEAIIIDAMPNELVQPGLKAAEAAGIPVISSNNMGSSPNPEIPSNGKPWPIADVTANFLEAGASSADFITSQSEGKANIMMTTDETQISVQVHEQGFKEELEKVCPECQLDELATSTTEVSSQTPQQVVSYLRTHPDVDWIYSGYDPQEVFIIPALEQAGLDEQVQISSVLGEAPNLEFIRKGQVQASDVAWDQHYTGWAMIDQILRQLSGKPLAEPANENVPEQLLVKENLPAATSEAYTASEVPYEEEYLKLWGVSK